MYVSVAQDMQDASETVCVVEVTDEFKVGMGLHQGLTLSPFLFLMVMDSLTGEVRQGSTWTNDAYR